MRTSIAADLSLNIAGNRPGMNQVAFDFVAAPAQPLETLSGNWRGLDSLMSIPIYQFQTRHVLANYFPAQNSLGAWKGNGRDLGWGDERR